MQDFVNKFMEKNISEDILGSIDKKKITFSRFWPLRRWGWVKGVNPLKKENLGRKYFSDNIE